MMEGDSEVVDFGHEETENKMQSSFASYGNQTRSLPIIAGAFREQVLEPCGKHFGWGAEKRT